MWATKCGGLAIAVLLASPLIPVGGGIQPSASDVPSPYILAANALGFAPAPAAEVPAPILSIGLDVALRFLPSQIFISPDAGTTVSFRLDTAHPVNPVLASPSVANVHYLLGRDQTHSSTIFERVVYADAWPGIDAVFSASGPGFKYDLLVDAGADPGAVSFVVDGAQKVEIDATGDLLVQTAAGTLIDEAPTAFQIIDGTFRSVAAAFTLSAGQRVGFQLGAYDRSHPLTVDPVIGYSTLVGGAGHDHTAQIDVADDGSVFVAGQTLSPSILTTSGAVAPTHGGGWDGFLVKFDPSGALVFATYIGGAGDDHLGDIAIAPDGDLLVSGGSSSLDFPISSNAFMTAPAPGDNSIVAKLRADGSAIVWATYFGGGCADYITALSSGSDGLAHVAGLTCSDQMPLRNAAQSVKGGVWDAFAAVFNADGSDLLWSTFFGGANYDHVHVAVVDSDGTTHIAGRTGSSDLPLMGALQPSYAGGWDIFVAGFAPDGQRIYSSYLGGAGHEFVEGMASAPSDGIVLGGWTASAALADHVPDLLGPGGDVEGFAARIDARGQLVWLTRIGGASSEVVTGLGVTQEGLVHLGGQTYSPDFPLVDAFQDGLAGDGDGFASLLSADGRTLLHSTFLGGTGMDLPLDLDVDAFGRAYLAGVTDSTDYPATQGADLGGRDMFVTQVIAGSRNGAPDCSSVSATTTLLWPPNHEIQSVGIGGVTDPEGDPVVVEVTGVEQDEPVYGTGDGSTGPDAVLLGGNEVGLRAERNGTGDGRVYHVTFDANDGQGGSCSATILITVPHSEKRPAVDGGARFDSMA